MQLKYLQQLFPFRTGLRIKEVCFAVGIRPTAFYAAAKRGEIRIRKIGRTSVVALTDLAEWLERGGMPKSEREVS